MIWENKFQGDGGQRLVNPGRGWYQLYSFLAQEAIHPDQLKWSLHAEETLAFVQIDISAYREGKIPPEGCQNIRDILHFFLAHGKEIILRVVYDREGKGLEKEPPFFSLVLEHLGQIRSLLEELSGGIFLCQGLLVGNWGEMHGSRYLEEEHILAMGEVLYGDGFPFWGSVRRPDYYRLLQKKCPHLTIYDDALLASPTHLGTFREENGQRELALLGHLGEISPFGGEVVCPGEEAEKQKALSPAYVVEELKRLHISYLNCVHHRELLGSWKEIYVEGTSLYDYVGAHLGYRLVVTAVKRKGWTKQRKLEILVENTGFGPLLEPCEFGCIYHTEEAEIAISLQEKRCIKKGTQSFLFTATIPPALGEGNLTLWGRRKKDGYPIQFANQGSQKEGLLLGRFRERTK